MEKLLISIGTALAVLIATWIANWVRTQLKNISSLQKGQAENHNNMELRLLTMEKKLNNTQIDEITSSYAEHQKILDKMEYLAKQYDRKIELLEKRLYNNMITNTEFYKEITKCKSELSDKMRDIVPQSKCSMESKSLIELSKRVLKNSIDIQEFHVLVKKTER